MAVIIVGAGITGVAAAIGLRRLGFDVRLYEARAAAEEIGAGITLWPNGVASLAALGIPLAERAQTFRLSEIRSRRGAKWRRMHLHRVGDALGHPTLLTGRRDVMAALQERLDAAGGVVRGDAEVTGVTGNAIELATGERVEGDAIIGADGVGSAVRRARFGPWADEDQGRTSYRGLAHRSDAIERAGVDFVELHGAGGRFAFYGIGDGRVAWYGNIIGPEADAPGSLAELADHFADWAAPVPQLIASCAPDDLHIARIRKAAIFDTRSDGDVTLIGDAAQPMTPDLGQGANQGLEDVVALVLAAAEHRGDWPAALRAYEAARCGVAARVADRSAKAGKLSNVPGVAGIWVRRLMWGLVPESTSVDSLVALSRDGVARAERLRDVSGGAAC